MARTEKGAASAAPASLFTWVETGPGRRRLVSRRTVGTVRAPAPEAEKPTENPEPTLKDLQARASELDIPGRSGMTKAELSKAIDKAGE